MKNKKLVIIIAAVVVVLAVVLAVVLLGGNKTPAAPTEKEYKLGMGVQMGLVGLNKTDYGQNAQVDATVATVVLDADGKIVLCRIDAIQNKADFTTEGKFTVTNLESKMELGSRYGMAGKVDGNNDGIKLEWDAQVKAFENHVIGMTAAEVAAMKTAPNFMNYQMSTDEDLLKAGCTIQITDLKAAVVKACKDDQGVSFKTAGTFTLGVAVESFLDEYSPVATEANPGVINMYSDMAASVVGADGKILASLNDAIQPHIVLDATGNILTDAPHTHKDGYPVFTGCNGTKRELKEQYGMAGKVDANNDGVKLEWYLQSAAFSKHVVGMTGAEVAAMPTAPNFMNYQMSTDEELLKAGCTIQITAIKAVVAESVTNAR
jgi:hypothetical protein